MESLITANPWPRVHTSDLGNRQNYVCVRLVLLNSSFMEPTKIKARVIFISGPQNQSPFSQFSRRAKKRRHISSPEHVRRLNIAGEDGALLCPFSNPSHRRVRCPFACLSSSLLQTFIPSPCPSRFQ